ncbi:MAG: LolA family protein [Solirubrobacteraceae bacterium]
MNRLRRISLARLIALVAAVLAVAGVGTALAAGALSGGGPKPPAKSLAQALHDVATAPAVDGVSADISFTNHLIDGASLAGGAGANPLLTGATGRLWAAPDGRVRLELQSDQGDAQVVSDGRTATIYDGTSNTAYVITLPAGAGKAPAGGADNHKPPTVAAIQGFLGRLARGADVSGAIPSNVAGREAYTVRIAPRHDGGLVGAAQLAWDAVTGTPLRAAVYAAGNPKPVLELKATHISFGKVPAATLAVAPPAGAKVVRVDLGAGAAAGAHRGAGRAKDVTGVKAVGAQLPFALKAPPTLVGLPRHEVRLLTQDGRKGALVTYGAGLGGIAVLQTPAQPAGAQAPPGRGDRGGLSLPKVSIGGTSGDELATALGTIVRFERGGVQYVIAGSVTPQAAEAAARAL